VFFFNVYSLGSRLSEGLAMRVADIDAQRARVQIRDSKVNRDCFVPLPAATLEGLDTDTHAVRRAVDIAHPQVAQLRQAQSAGIGQHPLENLPAQVNRRNLLPLMPQFRADRESGFTDGLALLGCQIL